MVRDKIGVLAAASESETLEYEAPQCVLRVACVRGVDRIEFLDNRQFNGDAFVLFAAAQRFLRETLPIAGRVRAGSVLGRARAELVRSEIHARLGLAVSERQLRRVLERLKIQGLVVSTGRGRSARWRRRDVRENG